MDIYYASDLHLEFGDARVLDILPEKGEVLILAGDILCLNIPEKSPKVKERNLNLFTKFFREVEKRFSQTYWILGNHEYYFSDLTTCKEELQSFLNLTLEKYSSVKIVDNEVIEHGDWVLFGATLWTDFGKHPLYSVIGQTQMNDYRRIHCAGKTIVPSQILDLHEETVTHLYDFLDRYKADAREKIIVTHHAPFFQSIPEKYLGHDLNYAYANTRFDYCEVLWEYPWTWIHGHIHHKCSYEIGKTNVLCNPKGYEGWESDLTKNFTFSRVKT